MRTATCKSLRKFLTRLATRRSQIELVESVWNGKVEHFKIKDAAHNIVWEKEGSGALDLLVNVINTKHTF